MSEMGEPTVKLAAEATAAERKTNQERLLRQVASLARRASERDEKILEAIRAGVPVREIASRANLSRDSVYKLAAAHHVRLPRAVRQQDVANAAGVSVMTVSRVFSSNDHVAAETRERILAIAKEMGYRPK